MNNPPSRSLHTDSYSIQDQTDLVSALLTFLQVTPAGVHLLAHDYSVSVAQVGVDACSA
jgi:hypothetical protein